ncbi:MAG: Phenylalanine--tRNA ligase beta subunit [Promethearchaeota archaeon]|nr:MAG: Phenylalanine--tRNA ligase beta subunit [Candidatus Lokiarchaeota archaeon]
MPTITLKIDRLEKLVGKELEIKDLEYDLQWIGLDLDDIKKEEREIKVEYNPNRPDYSSPEGIARSLKGYYELELGLPKFEIKPATIELEVKKPVKQVRPYIVCALVKNVHLDEDEVATLMNIQEQLHWAVGRDRKKVAIGVHDYDKVNPPFRYTAVKPDSVSFTPLQGDGYPMNLEEILLLHEKGMKYAHILEGKKKYPIIFDKNDEVLSFPPIINGVLTTVTDKTKNIFLDLTGTEFDAVNLALNILSTTLLDMGAEIEQVKLNYEGGKNIETPDLTPKKWKIKEEYINNILGLDLTTNEIIHCLKKTRLNAEEGKNSGSLDVWIPAFRGDFMHPVDIAEECAIGYGYQNLKKTLPEECIGKYHPIQQFSNKIRTIMIGAGYLESLNFILSNSERHYEFMKENKEESNLIQIANPVSKEFDTARTAILPKLMETIAYNRSEEKPIRLFEVGDVIILDSKRETGTKRKIHVAAATYHENADFTEIRSLLDYLIISLGYGDDYKVDPGNNPSYIGGRYGEVYINDEKIGNIGEIHPEVLNNFKLEFPIAALELNIQKLLE